MKKYIYVLSLLLVCHTIQAQSYMGFLGKRNVINLNLVGGFASTPQTRSSIGPFFAHPNAKVELELDRANNATNSVGLSIRYMRFEYNSGMVQSPFMNFCEYYPQFYFPGFAKVNQTTLGVYKKKFLHSKGGFAPQGRYFQYGLNLHLLSVGESEMYISDKYASPALLKPIESVNSSKYASILLAYGQHKIIRIDGNTYIINASVGTNIPFSYLTAFKELLNFTSYTEADATKAIVLYANELDLFNFKLGVGYLF